MKDPIRSWDEVYLKQDMEEFQTGKAPAPLNVAEQADRAIGQGELAAGASRPIAMYCGMGGNAWLASQLLRPVVEEAGYTLQIMSEWDDADVKWNRDTWVQDMLKADVILCPQREGIQDAKSSIKATVAMALGLPVICSRIPSYEEIIQSGHNGFLASIHRLQEWKDALLALLDPGTRARVGTAGRASVKDKFSLPAIVSEWRSLFGRLLASPGAQQVTPQGKQEDRVDLIIATYQNLEYIKLTVQSILLNTDSPYQIIISDAGSGPEVWAYLRTLKGIVVLGSPDKRLNFSEACNAGLAASNSKYVCILNSDLIVSKGWLRAMVEKMETQDRLAACGVLSNCDAGWLFNAPGMPEYNMQFDYQLDFGNGPTMDILPIVSLRPGMKIEEIQQYSVLENLYRFMNTSNRERAGRYAPQAWVAAYCTLFARSALNEVGYFDPTFRNGCEDLDLCKRLSGAGYQIGQALDAFVFHFGGVSRGAYQAEAREQYNAEDARNHQIYRQKWARKKIAIWTGPAWENWTRETVDAGMGGSETWAAEIAAEFQRKGFQVLLFNQCEKPHLDRDGVAYYPHQMMEDMLAYDQVEAFIASRSCDPLKLKAHALRYYVMIHDIWLSQDPAYDVMPWAVHGYAYLSEWHRDFLLSHHKGIPPGKMFLTHNGVDQNLYKFPPDVGCTYDVYLLDGTELHSHIDKKNQTVYSSSPDRGLEQLLDMLPAIRKAVPDFRVLVAYGFHNWESAARLRNNPEELAAIARIKSKMDQAGVEYLGRISKTELAKHQMNSKVWLYPTWFSETFCITAVENGLARNAMLTTDLAGLRTIVDQTGILIPWSGTYTKEYLDAFEDAAILLLKDDELRSQLTENAFQKMQRYTWDAAAQGWLDRMGVKA